MSKYPAQLDDSTSVPAAPNNQSLVTGAAFNKLRGAVLSIEKELGVQPKTVYTDVRGRLDTIESNLGNLQIITLNKDLGGTVEEPLVIGIQGQPVSNLTPDVDDCLVWGGISWNPQSVLESIVDGTVPGQTIVWNGSQYNIQLLTQNDIAPGYQFSVSSTTANFVSVGQSWQQGFTVTFNDPPSSASLTDSEGGMPKNVLADILLTNTCNSNYFYTKNSFGDSVVFTFTTTNGYVTKTTTSTLTWGQPLYWGVGPASSTGQSFIQGLAGSLVNNTKNISFTVTPGATDKVYFACRAAYGDANFSVNNLIGGFSKVDTLLFDNGFGFLENYDLYESDNVNLGTIEVTVI